MRMGNWKETWSWRWLTNRTWTSPAADRRSVYMNIENIQENTYSCKAVILWFHRHYFAVGWRNRVRPLRNISLGVTKEIEAKRPKNKKR